MNIEIKEYTLLQIIEESIQESLENLSNNIVNGILLYELKNLYFMNLYNDKATKYIKLIDEFANNIDEILSSHFKSIALEIDIKTNKLINNENLFLKS